MINKMSSITIKKGFFDKEVDFVFFPKENQRLAIIHGRNGSGKSTIAEALNKFKEGKLDSNDKCIFKDRNNNELDSSKIIEKTYVFNEEYIDKNIRFNNANGFKSVVIFGEQVKIDDEIKLLEISLEKLADEIKNYNIDEFEKNKGTLNPKTHKDSCIDKLKDGWAIRDKEIKGNSRASSVNDAVLSETLKYKNNSNLNLLKKDFEEMLKNYKNINEGTERKIIPLPEKIYFEDQLITLVNKKIDKPISNELEEKILKVIEKFGNKQIDEIDSNILKSENEFCPLCMKDIDFKYKQHLENSIKNAINEEMEQYRKSLDEFLLEELILDLNNYDSIDEELLKQLKENYHDVNEILERYRLLINQRKDKIFDTFTEEKKGYDYKFNELIDAINKFNVKINTYNSDIKSKKEIRNKLEELSYKISFLEIELSYKLYLDVLEKKQEIVDKFSEATNSRSSVLNEIKALNAKKQNIEIALDKINKDLEYIFYDKNRLTLELIDDKYHVKSNGKNISLKNLSTGEKNAISLCYFFIDILNNTDEKSVFNEDLLIVLDDPISSFDIENKVGIFSYLRSVINKITRKNENSKIIIFTHELDSFFNFEKISSDLSLNKITFFGQLRNKYINKFDFNRRSVYTSLLKDIYLFAKGERNDLEPTIGNTMRKVLEAYATFTYSTGIDSLSTDEDILSKLEDDNSKEYFSNLMYRLVLNDESHLEYRTYAITENNFYDFITLEEKIRTAQEILVYLYKLDCLHLKCHLKDVRDIEMWEQRIFSNSYIHVSNVADSKNVFVNETEDNKVFAKTKK